MQCLDKGAPGFVTSFNMPLFFPSQAVVAGRLSELFLDLVCFQENCQHILKDKAKKKAICFLSGMFSYFSSKNYLI